MVASHIPRSAFDPIVLVALVLVGAYVLLKPDLGEVTELRFAGHHHTAAAGRGRAGRRLLRRGTGPGTGSFFVFSLVGLLGYSFLEASAKARLANWATNLGALVVFAPQGAVLWKDGLILGACNLVAGTSARVRRWPRERRSCASSSSSSCPPSWSELEATWSESGDYVRAHRRPLVPRLRWQRPRWTRCRGFLDFHRDTMLIEDGTGLTQEQLAQTHAPSGLTLGGLLKHAALN